MLKRYKEILFGVLLGAAMWIVDAAMHAEIGGEVGSHGFWAEIFEPNPTTVFFRLVYFVLAAAFGTYLWRANWREREVRALEQAVVAFQRQLDRPALRILSRARQLQSRNSVMLDETAAHLTDEISADARQLDELAQKYLHFSELVRAGQTSEAVKTLQELEVWLNAQNSNQPVKL
ncbi:MAG: hypothetical protein M3033_08310 [Acidobacteriota bacterium]|nr:hypothetical protein [Acidobacteriota bacterium]